MGHIYTAAFAAILCLATPTLGQDLYECKFPNKADNLGYVSPTLVLSRVPGGTTATVVDAVIQQETGGPIEVQIVEENDRKFSMTWIVKVVSPENDYMRIAYRLSVQTGSLAATLSAKPLGYLNNFSSRGSCTRMSS